MEYREVEHKNSFPIPVRNRVPADNMDGNSGTIDFYYFLPSPPCRSVMLLAKALGIELNMKIVNLRAGEHMTPEFLKMNPQHSIPTLNDKGFILWESRAILQYLADQYGKDDTLNPKEPKKAALVNHRLYFDACTLYSRLFNYFYPVLFQNQPRNAEKAERFEEALGYLDSFLEKQVWVAGPYMTIADFALVSSIATAKAVMFDITKYPNVDTWYSRAKKTMADYDFEEINEKGAAALGEMFRNSIQ